MKILAVDSTAVTASIAITEDERLLAEYTVCCGNTHSETLLPMIESALKTLRLTVSDIDLFACSAGPGSFTGVRIGAAVIKGLTFGKGRACVGVSTLEALAYNLCDHAGLICPVMNARRSQVYTALFRVRDGRLERLCPDRAVSLDELARELEAYADETVYLSGDGYDMTRAALSACRLGDTPEEWIYQSGYSVAMCALNAFEAGVRTTDAELVPTYLRMPQAERERLEKLSNS